VSYPPGYRSYINELSQHSLGRNRKSTKLLIEIQIEYFPNKKQEWFSLQHGIYQSAL